MEQEEACSEDASASIDVGGVDDRGTPVSSPTTSLKLAQSEEDLSQSLPTIQRSEAVRHDATEAFASQSAAPGCPGVKEASAQQDGGTALSARQTSNQEAQVTVVVNSDDEPIGEALQRRNSSTSAHSPGANTSSAPQAMPIPNSRQQSVSDSDDDRAVHEIMQCRDSLSSPPSGSSTPAKPSHLQRDTSDVTSAPAQAIAPRSSGSSLGQAAPTASHNGQSTDHPSAALHRPNGLAAVTTSSANGRPSGAPSKQSPHAEESPGARPAEPPASSNENEIGSSDDDATAVASTDPRRAVDPRKSATQRKKRRTILPVIPRGSRCGQCHTCRNPQACCRCCFAVVCFPM
jgi:hypothetical protein